MKYWTPTQQIQIILLGPSAVSNSFTKLNHQNYRLKILLITTCLYYLTSGYPNGYLILTWYQSHFLEAFNCFHSFTICPFVSPKPQIWKSFATSHSSHLHPISCRTLLFKIIIIMKSWFKIYGSISCVCIDCNRQTSRCFMSSRVNEVLGILLLNLWLFYEILHYVNSQKSISLGKLKEKNTSYVVRSTAYIHEIKPYSYVFTIFSIIYYNEPY